jgi:hypothetical protein
MRIQTAIDIQAPPDRVWATMTDFEHWPEWNPTVLSIGRLDPGPFGVGRRVFIHQRKLNPTEWQCTELDHAMRSFTWATRNPAIQVTAGHRVEPIPSGSRVTLTLDLTGLLAPLVGIFAGDLTNSYVAQEAEGLRRRCESSEP